MHEIDWITVRIIAIVAGMGFVVAIWKGLRPAVLTKWFSVISDFEYDERRRKRTEPGQK